MCYAIVVAMTGDDVSDGLGDNNGGRGSETGDPRRSTPTADADLNRRGIWFRGREERLQSQRFEEEESMQRRDEISILIAY